MGECYDLYTEYKYEIPNLLSIEKKQRSWKQYCKCFEQS
jgi:hypothetical protein